MTPQALQEQRQTALLTANETRTKRAQLKRGLRSGDVTLAQAFREPVFADSLLIEVVRYTGAHKALAAVGKQALRDNVNLMVTVGRASERSKAWVAKHGYRHWRPSP